MSSSYDNLSDGYVLELTDIYNDLVNELEQDKSITSLNITHIFSLLEAVGMKQLSDNEITNFTNKLNTDNTITLNNFLILMNELLSTSSINKNDLIKSFELLDENNSGKIHINEFKKIYIFFLI